MPGLTETGFSIKRLQEILEELKERVAEAFGSGGVTVQTHDESGFGILCGIFARSIAEVWELAEAVYSSQYPNSASGVALDNVLALANLKRLAKTQSSVWQVLTGDSGSVIPKGSLVEHASSQERFQVTEDVTLDSDLAVGAEISVGGAAIGASYIITIDGVPRDILAGTYSVDTNIAAALAAEIDRTDFAIFAIDQTTRTFTGPVNAPELRNYFAVGKRMRVTGGTTNDGVYTVGALGVDATNNRLTVTVVEAIPSATPGSGKLRGYVKADAAGNVVTITSYDQLPSGASDLSNQGFSITLTTSGGGTLAFDSISVPHEVEAISDGEIGADVGTLVVIATPVSGWVSTTNPVTADVGNLVESDPDARTRRAQSLMVHKLQTVLRNLPRVDSVKVYPNDTGTTDSEGRPGHSVECVVTGGDDDDIAFAIYETKAAGIETYGNTAVPIVDSEGFSRVVKFSRPTEVAIYVSITVTSLYAEESLPTNPAGAIQEAVVTYGDTLAEGVNVIAKRVEAAVSLAVPGVENFTAKIGTSPNPSGTATISISAQQRAVFDASRVTVQGV